MLKRILLAGLVAGLIGGIVISIVQEFTTTPLILHAEEFENAAPSGHSHAPASGQSHASSGGEAVAWAPADGIERTLFTSFGNIVAGMGFALILVAGFALHGGEIDGRRGIIWGLAGFAVFSLAPALGLPPEVPGAMAAELVPRQGWWLSTAAATALGLGLMVFGRKSVWIVLGVVVLAAPHIIGAPQPEKLGGPVPPELAAHFVAASLVTAAVFWAMLGWLSGTLYRRLS
jgi:cobalt transporter subunit CbtA